MILRLTADVTIETRTSAPAPETARTSTVASGRTTRTTRIATTTTTSARVTGSWRTTVRTGTRPRRPVGAPAAGGAAPAAPGARPVTAMVYLLVRGRLPPRRGEPARGVSRGAGWRSRRRTAP